MGIIKDLIIKSYVRHVLIPKVIVLDRAGFILEDFRKIGLNVWTREFFLPEELVIEIEREFENDVEYLYSVGKRFGYYYASLSNLPQKSKYPEKKMENYIKFQVIYTAGTYANDAKYKVSLKERKIEFLFDKYIVCSRNGKGFIFSESGIAGIWSWMMEEEEIACIQPMCQGRGDKVCKCITAPSEELIESFNEYSSKVKIQSKVALTEGRMTDKYRSVNRIKNVGGTSLKDLISKGVVRFSHGMVLFHSSRHFLCESSFLYFLDLEAKKRKEKGRCPKYLSI